MNAAWPRLGIALHVDGLTVEVLGRSRAKVAYELTAVTKQVVHHFQELLRLEVCAKKSTVVAGRPSIATSVARMIRTKRLTARRSTKLLGVASAGGRRRAVGVLKQRLKQLAQRTPRIRALRRVGLSAVGLVRAAGTPVITYGVDVTGMNESHLRSARSAVARALSPAGEGRNPDATLYAIDGASDTTDPAFYAHVLPMKMLAMAWWQRWQPAGALTAAVRRAEQRVVCDGKPIWARVAGPVAAAVASMARLGWPFLSGSRLRRDDGETLDLMADPPVVVIDAVRAAVRRWRLKRIASTLPELVLHMPDFGCHGSWFALPPCRFPRRAWQLDEIEGQLQWGAKCLEHSLQATSHFCNCWRAMATSSACGGTPRLGDRQ